MEENSLYKGKTKDLIESFKAKNENVTERLWKETTTPHPPATNRINTFQK